MAPPRLALPYACRRSTVAGEGPDPRMGDRDNRSPYGPDNFRFTVSKDGKTLYVLQMGAPEAGSEILLTSFARDVPGAGLEVSNVILCRLRRSAKMVPRRRRPEDYRV